MEIIKTNNAPAAIGPYSQAIKTNNLIFVSGQIPIDPITGLLKDNIVDAANQCFLNVKNILEAADSDISKVIKTTVFVSDIKNFDIVNKIYATYFVSNPARSLVEVSNLPKNALLEIEVIAEI